MRHLVLSLLIVLALAFTTQAQDVATVLRGFEKATGDLQSLYVETKRTTIDKALGAKDIYTGYAIIANADGKVGARTRLQLSKVGNPDVFEKFILSWPDLYVYAPASKVVRVQPMLKNRQGPMQPSLLSFLLGVDAKQALVRYKIEPDGRDKNYHLLLIEPKAAEDKGEFTMARIAIRRTDHLLGQIWYRQPNGADVTWDFTNLRPNFKVEPKHFVPEVPNGWRVDDLRPKPAVGQPVIPK